MLSHEAARAFYDRLGAGQDTQRFFEDPATRDLVQHAEFHRAERVLEFGCGTGRFARELLTDHLPPGACYQGLDQSSTMVRLARERLASFGTRATVEQCEGSPRFDVAPGSLDRIVSNYVLDLLSENDMRLFIAQAERALAPEGRLCLVSLTRGTTLLSRLFIWGWERIHALSPRWVGGCRPIEILDLLPDTRWRIEHLNVVTALGMPSEVVVASTSGVTAG